MAAMMSAAAVSARVAPAASGKKMTARTSAFSAAMPKAAKRANACVVSRGAMRVVAEVEEFTCFNIGLYLLSSPLYVPSSFTCFNIGLYLLPSSLYVPSSFTCGVVHIFMTGVHSSLAAS